MASGKIIDLMTDFKKDNTGYHLKHLFIGSEGTLGVVTKVAILCAPAPNALHVAFLGLKSFDDVIQTFLQAKRQLGEILSACEVMDAECLKASQKHFHLKSPIEENSPFYMLLETSGSNGSHDMAKFQQFLENAMDRGIIVNGTITSNSRQMENLWKLRELAPVGLINSSFCFCYDISVPLRNFYRTVELLKERLKNFNVLVVGFGHLGDSNLHVIVSCPEFSQEVYDRIEPFLYEHTATLKGSFSAEHGVGFHKSNYLKYSKAREAIAIMHELKKTCDSQGILNPYKVLN